MSGSSHIPRVDLLAALARLVAEFPQLAEAALVVRLHCGCECTLTAQLEGGGDVDGLLQRALDARKPELEERSALQ